MKALRVPFAAGALAGCLFVAALLILDVGGLGSLIARDQAALLPLFMLMAGFAFLFGIAVAASTVATVNRTDARRRRAKPDVVANLT
jgi:arginine exporter protein ArgO